MNELPTIILISSIFILLWSIITICCIRLLMYVTETWYYSKLITIESDQQYIGKKDRRKGELQLKNP